VFVFPILSSKLALRARLKWRQRGSLSCYFQRSVFSVEKENDNEQADVPRKAKGVYPLHAEGIREEKVGKTGIYGQGTQSV